MNANRKGYDGGNRVALDNAFVFSLQLEFTRIGRFIKAVFVGGRNHA